MNNLDGLKDTWKEKLATLSSDQQILSVRNVIEDRLKLATQPFKCQKGCANCCFLPIEVLKGEVDILKKHFSHLPEERKKLAQIQKSASTEQEWFTLETQFRRCVFLNSDSECSIYKDRPLACRLMYVDLKSDPKNCGSPLLNRREKVIYRKDPIAVSAFNAVAELQGYWLLAPLVF